MTAGRPHRRLLTAFALTLAATALALPAGALGRRAACPAASHAHSKRAVHSCARKAHGRKAHVKRAVKGHGRHAALTRPATRSASASSGAGGAGGAMVPATCEDGSGALATGPGAVSCSDGSEPTCDDGSRPARSGAFTALVCPAPSEPEGGPSEEPVCEEGSTSSCSGDEFESPDATPARLTAQPVPAGEG
jgi:hypothetical protein